MQQPMATNRLNTENKIGFPITHHIALRLFYFLVKFLLLSWRFLLKIHLFVGGIKNS